MSAAERETKIIKLNDERRKLLIQLKQAGDDRILFLFIYGLINQIDKEIEELTKSGKSSYC